MFSIFVTEKYIFSANFFYFFHFFQFRWKNGISSGRKLPWKFPEVSRVGRNVTALNFHDSSDICPMGFIYSIQICEISHQTFGPSHRKCPMCPMIFMNTGDRHQSMYHLINTLVCGVGHYRRASNVGLFNLAPSSVMLACCRGPTPHIHLMARFWIFSKAYLSLLACGSHMVDPYSAVDLTKLKYAVCFSYVGHFLRFLRINPRRLLHLFTVIVMWSEKCRDLCNKMPK